MTASGTVGHGRGKLRSSFEWKLQPKGLLDIKLDIEQVHQGDDSVVVWQSVDRHSKDLYSRVIPENASEVRFDD